MLLKGNVTSMSPPCSSRFERKLVRERGIQIRPKCACPFMSIGVQPSRIGTETSKLVNATCSVDEESVVRSSLDAFWFNRVQLWKMGLKNNQLDVWCARMWLWRCKKRGNLVRKLQFGQVFAKKNQRKSIKKHKNLAEVYLFHFL